ncbi:hypothetical protein ACIBCM_11800 [Streptomyces sp. NPDC051018]|uniref:hypothetical protein n=1 Tax=Streptomyces sp. NPDC051018 TaxID=3365639 RepID=UPI0037B2B9D5
MSSGSGIDESHAIKALLDDAERHAEGSGRSAVTTETVYAGAARARWRRRAAMAGAAVAVVLAGVVTVPVLDRGEDGPKVRQSTLAAEGINPGDIRGRAQAKRLATVLDGMFPNITKVEKVQSGSLWLPGQQVAWETKPTARAQPGALDGHYLVTTVVEGEKRYSAMSFTVLDKPTVLSTETPIDVPGDICRPTSELTLRGCQRRELPSGQVLTTWAGSGNFEPNDVPWTVENHALLTLPSGGVLLYADGAQAASDKVFARVRSGNGELKGTHKGLRNPVRRANKQDFVALTRDEVRELIVRPEFLPPG